MKKSVIAIIVLVVVIGIIAIYNKKITSMFFGNKSGQMTQQIDLEVINDTSNTASVSYRKDMKKQPMVAKANEIMTGGQGFMHIQTPDKKGYYELNYAFPRPVNNPSKITLSQIINAIDTKSIKVEGAVYKATGTIDDIVVIYEEIPLEDEGI